MRDNNVDIKFHNYMGLRFIYQELNEPENYTDSIPNIFIGGAFQSVQNVQNYAKFSAEFNHTIMVDILGFGDSDVLDSSYKMEVLANSIEHFILKKGFKKVNVIGTSYGAVTAYMLASIIPEKMNRMILGGFMDKFDQATYDAWFNALQKAKKGQRTEFAEDMTGLLLNLEKGSDIRLQSFISTMMKKKLLAATYAEIDKFIFSIERLMANNKEFPAPQCPTLMMTGEYDSFTTPAHHQKLFEQAPQADFTLIENADHMFHLQQFEITSQLIKTFLTSGDINAIPGHRLSKKKLTA